MGIMCPICKTHQSITANIRPPGASNDFADNIIAHALECGHEVGKEDFNKLQQAYDKKLAEVSKKKRELDNELKDFVGAEWIKIKGGVAK